MCRRRGATARGNRKFACGGQFESGSAILAIARQTNGRTSFRRTDALGLHDACVRRSARPRSTGSAPAGPRQTASCAAARSVRASVSTTTLRSAKPARGWQARSDIRHCVPGSRADPSAPRRVMHKRLQRVRPRRVVAITVVDSITAIDVGDQIESKCAL